MNLFNWFKPRKNNGYICTECGKIHGGWPALAFDAPVYYDDLEADKKKEWASLDSDFCVIHFPDQTVRFIRVVLTQEVLDAEEDLDYGLWVSLSEQSFQNYQENFKNRHHETQYFGWLSNLLPDYEDTMSIPTTVVTQKGNQRPSIFPHKDHDHEFVIDFYQGISAHEAQRRVDNMLNM